MIWGRKDGEVKKYLWFAWYPRRLESGRWIWWEKAEVTKVNEFTEINEMKEVKDEK